MEKLGVGSWLPLPFLGLLLLLTFVGFPFGGPLALVVLGLVGLVIVAVLAINVPRGNAELVERPERRRAVTQPGLSLWDLAFVGLLGLVIPAAIFHYSQGRYASAILVVAAMIVGLSVLVTSWLREPTSEAEAEPEVPVPQTPATYATARQKLTRESSDSLANWLSMGMLSGFVATGMMTSILLLAYGMAVLVGSADPQAPPLLYWLWGLAHNPVVGTATVALPLAIVLHFLAGIAWAVGYTGLVEPHLSGPGWRRGALFSLLPWLVSLLVFMPVMGGGLLGFSLEDGPLPLLGNLLFHLGYGTILGEFYASERILAESDEVKAEVPAELAQWSGPVRRESCRGWCLAG